MEEMSMCKCSDTRRSVRRLLLSGFIVCLLSINVMADTGPGSISGTVSLTLDASPEDKLAKLSAMTNKNQIVAVYDYGKTRFKAGDVSGAEVRINNSRSGFAQTARVGEAGQFSFKGLRLGEYEVTAWETVTLDGRQVQARWRTLLSLTDRMPDRTRLLMPLTVEAVSVSGRVVDSSGRPVAGVRLRADQCPRADSGELRGWYPPQQAKTAEDGRYVFQDLIAPDFTLVAYYLMRTNDFTRANYWEDKPFFVRVCVSDARYPACAEEHALITRGNAEYARRYLSLMNKLDPKGWREQDGVALPESEGNVVFVPDIVVRKTAE
jgi:hypothetical protein